MLKRIALAIVAVCLFQNGMASLVAQERHCFMQKCTYSEELAQSHVVVYGTLKNLPANKDATGKEVSKSIVRIEGWIKKHPSMKDMTTIQLNLPSPIGYQSGTKLLLFGEVNEDKPEFYLAQEYTPEFIEYLKSLNQIVPKDVAKRLSVVIHNLGHANDEIRGDAYKELDKAEYHELKKW